MLRPSSKVWLARRARIRSVKLLGSTPSRARPASGMPSSTNTSKALALWAWIARLRGSAATITAFGWIEPGMWIGSRSQIVGSTGSARAHRPIAAITASRDWPCASTPSGTITSQYPARPCAMWMRARSGWWGIRPNTNSKRSSRLPRRIPARKRP